MSSRGTGDRALPLSCSGAGTSLAPRRGGLPNLPAPRANAAEALFGTGTSPDPGGVAPTRPDLAHLSSRGTIDRALPLSIEDFPQAVAGLCAPRALLLGRTALDWGGHFPSPIETRHFPCQARTFLAMWRALPPPLLPVLGRALPLPRQRQTWSMDTGTSPVTPHKPPLIKPKHAHKPNNIGRERSGRALKWTTTYLNVGKRTKPTHHSLETNGNEH